MERNYYFVSQQNQNNTYVEAFREMFKQVLSRVLTYQRRIMENKFNRHITNKQLQYKAVSIC